jgi:nucleoside-diphosphate-sugar epimerase
MLDPAVKGTINVLNACAKSSSVKRVVVTSSLASVIFNSRPQSPGVIDETWFSDAEYCKQNKAWYQLSKTLAEETAWKFAKEKGIDIVTINPAVVIGTLLQPTLNASCDKILQLMNGSSTYPNMTLGWVSVKDVAEAHILAFEVPSANGRYILVENVAHYSEIVKILSKLYPGCALPTKCADDNPFAPTYTVSKERIEKLGLKYTPIEKALRDTVESLKEKKLLNLDSNL